AVNPPPIDPIRMLRPRRPITGMSAILLPFTEAGDIDWQGFDDHVSRTAAAGLVPAVNMDTGFGNLLDEPTKRAVLDRTRAVLGVKKCVGAKRWSLSRELEWQRVRLRDEVRPDFKVLTGNDLAIDMVMYGSDYLLGLSTFAPDLFAKRDAYWLAGDPRFYE